MIFFFLQIKTVMQIFNTQFSSTIRILPIFDSKLAEFLICLKIKSPFNAKFRRVNDSAFSRYMNRSRIKDSNKSAHFAYSCQFSNLIRLRFQQNFEIDRDEKFWECIGSALSRTCWRSFYEIASLAHDNKDKRPAIPLSSRTPLRA